MKYPSKLIEEAVAEIAKLPGIGRKSALRLALHLLKADASQTQRLTHALNRLKVETRFCQRCHNLSDDTFCQICISPKRDKHVICVVQDIRDVMAIENTGQFQGLYHVLGGIISPLSGIGPEDLHIDSLVERIQSSLAEEPVKEIILALSPTMEGDTTAYYLRKRLESFSIPLSTIARGIPIGGDLEYTDEITLGRSIASRITF
ncbi:MAG: recombination mediator RecR [Spirosomataceae bacterium]